MTEKIIEGTQMPTHATAHPAEIADALSRIDAILDELYSLRQMVRSFLQAQSDVAQNDSLREPSPAIYSDVATTTEIASPQPAVSESIDAFRLAVAELPQESLTRQLVGSLASGLPDVLYTNREIEEMRFGDEWP